MGKKRINSRSKGAAGERELSHALMDLLRIPIRRGQQFSGIEGDDVVGLTGIHVECKRVEALNIGNAIDQSVRDAKEGEVPAVFHRKNKKPWLVTVRLQDLLQFTTTINSLVIEERKEDDRAVHSGAGANGISANGTIAGAATGGGSDAAAGDSHAGIGD